MILPYFSPSLRHCDEMSIAYWLLRLVIFDPTVQISKPGNIFSFYMLPCYYTDRNEHQACAWNQAGIDHPCRLQISVPFYFMGVFHWIKKTSIIRRSSVRSTSTRTTSTLLAFEEALLRCTLFETYFLWWIIFPYFLWFVSVYCFPGLAMFYSTVSWSLF